MYWIYNKVRNDSQFLGYWYLKFSDKYNRKWDCECIRMIFTFESRALKNLRILSKEYCIYICASISIEFPILCVQNDNNNDCLGNYIHADIKKINVL